MTLQEIKTAIGNGKTVHWKNSSYVVTKDKYNNYFIEHEKGNCIGLTQKDETTLNGKESEFYIAITVETYVLPIYWANYLLYGDNQYLYTNEENEINAYTKDFGACVSVDFDTADFKQFCGVGCEVCTFTFHK